MSDKIEDGVIDILKKSGLFDQLAAIAKDITPGDVHVSSAGANGEKKPKSLFTAAIENVTDNIEPADAEGRAVKAMEVEKAARMLRPIDDKVSHSPFPYDADAMGKLRPDQVPRYLGAITNPAALETKTMRLSSLVASQDRVDPNKVGGLMAAGKIDGPPPVVVRYNARNYVGDGHHRLTAAWMNGENTADVKFLDITAKDNALKSLAFDVEGETDGHDAEVIDKTEPMPWSIPFNVEKADADKQMIFGWASIVEKDGRLIIDKQDDAILPSDLEAAVYDYVLEARDYGDMHTLTGVGKLIESCVFTIEKQDALGIVIKNKEGHRIVGWWAGWKVDSADLWKDYRAGKRPELSIGGSGVRLPIPLD